MIFRNQNTAYTIKKRKGKLSSIGGIPNSVRMDSSIGRAALLHWIRSTWQLLHRRASVVWTAHVERPRRYCHRHHTIHRAITCIGLQIEVVVDYEISLCLPPCVASRVTRIAKQRRLQGWWQQRRRWIRLVARTSECGRCSVCLSVCLSASALLVCLSTPPLYLPG